MKNLHHRLQEGVLSALWRAVSTYPRAILVAALVLTVASSVYAWMNLRMTGDQDRLVSPDLPYQKAHLENLRNFGDQEYVYTVVETGGSDEGRQQAEAFVENLAERLRGHRPLLREVFYRVTPEDLGDAALQLASPEELAGLTRVLTAMSPYIDAWFEDRTLSNLMLQVSRLFREGQHSLADLDDAMAVRGFEWLSRFTATIRGALDGKVEDGPAIDLNGAVGSYLEAGDGSYLIMKILPAKDFSTLEIIDVPLKLIRSELAATRKDFPLVRAGITGRPALQADEMETTNNDMTRASVVDTLLVAFLFVIVLHGWLRPLLIMVTLGVSIAWTFGFAAVTVGELNLLSVVFALVLVGIGVDYGVHIVMRFIEGTHAGYSVDEAVRAAIYHTGPGIVMGVSCTVCTFYAVLGSDFRGLAELGLIGGTGILLCLIAMMAVLPAMLLLAGRQGYFPKTPPRVVSLPVFQWFSDRPRAMLLILAGLTLAASPGLLKVRFDYNLLKLQSQGLESVEYERRLTDSEDQSTWFAVLKASSVEAVKTQVAKARSLPSVGKVESILDYLPEGRDDGMQSLAELRALVGRWVGPVSPPPTDQPNLLVQSFTRLKETLEALSEKLFVAGAGSELAFVERSIDQLAEAAVALESDPESVSHLTGFWTRVVHDVQSVTERVYRWVTAEPVTVERLPEFVRSLFIGQDGRFQIKVSPRGDIWDFKNLQRFVDALRGVDPEASGVPVVVLESAYLMHRTFLYAAGVTVLLVSLILWVYARSIRFVLLALAPLAVGVLWLLEWMGWMGVDFNLANFFAIPMLIAVGVDGGVHLLDRWGELKGRADLFSTSTPTAVASSFMTTITGFGGLLFADHQGLASLGAVMVLGSVTGMGACLLVLPCALKVFGDMAPKREDL
ncbi:MAG: MMPL family transporter [Syntrophobacteraceae bacterium]